MASRPLAWLDRAVLGAPAEAADRLWSIARQHLAHAPSWAAVSSAGRQLIRYLSAHTGIPALVVAAVLVAVGYRLLKKTVRFGLEVAIVAAALGLMTVAGWIQW